MSTFEELKVDVDRSASNVQSWFMRTNELEGGQVNMAHPGFDIPNSTNIRNFQNVQPVEIPMNSVNLSNHAVNDLDNRDTSAEHTPSAQQIGNVQDIPSNSKVNDRVAPHTVKENKLKHTFDASKQSASTPHVKIDRKKPPAKRLTQKKSQASDVRNDPTAESARGDQFAMWYQMMSQYYSQYYPGYGTMPTMNSPKTNHNQPADVGRQYYQTVAKPQARKLDPQKQSFGYAPPYVPPYGAHPTSHQLTPNAVSNQMDYANYYQQYFYGVPPAAAANMWPGYYPFPWYMNTGRQTPKIYPNPHVRAWFSCPGLLLQVLPNRPSDGELARVELLHFSRLANDAVAEAIKRTENNRTNRGYSNFVDVHREQLADANRDGFSGNTSGLDSPDGLSSIQCPTGDEESGDDADTRACAMIALTWDRIDHVGFPGPLDPAETLKCDVSAFLRKKLAEIQDRLPTDWESASLLISYLQLLVNNNGVVPQRDLVTLLLEGHEPQTQQYHRTSAITVNTKSTANNLPYPSTLAQQARGHLTDSLSSLHSIQLPSGRQSPHMPYGMYGMLTPSSGKVDLEPNQMSHLRAASEAGGNSSSQAILRRAAATVVSPHTSNGARAEDEQVDRFRTLLMYGQAKKALLHACNFHLWGHAFTLAHRMGQPVLEKVIDSFLTCAVAPTDPILSLYQLKAGEIPQIVCEAAYGKGSDNGEWRPHLAMIVSNESTHPLYLTSLQRLGDSLLSRRLVYAAHLCYLLMGAQYDQTHGEQGQLVYRLPDKVWLLGVAQKPTNPSEMLTAPVEAIQLTEIYEYAMQLANRNYRLAQLLPLRMMYATRLMDAGLLVKAYHYLAAIGNSILAEASASTHASAPVMYSLIANCLRLAEPLSAHPDLDDLEFLVSDSSRFPVGRRMARTSNRWSAGAPLNSNDDWIVKLRELYGQMHSKFRHSKPMAAVKASSMSPQSREPTFSHLTPQHQQRDHSPHGRQRADSKQLPPHIPTGQMGQHMTVKSEMPSGSDARIRSDSLVYPGPLSPAFGGGTGVINRPRIKTEEVDGQDRGHHMEAVGQVTPTNMRGDGQALSLGMNLQKLKLSEQDPQHHHNNHQLHQQQQQHYQPLSTATRHDRVWQNHHQQQQQPVESHHQWTAAPPSPSAVSTSTSHQGTSGEQQPGWMGPGQAYGGQRQVGAHQGGSPSSDSFFTPANVQQQQLHQLQQQQASDHGPSSFDYFAGIAQQAGPRSRTTSGSSNTGTVVNNDQTRSRSSSGASQVRRNSATYGKPTFSSIQHQNANQQPPAHIAGRQHSQYPGSHPNQIKEVNEESPGKTSPSEDDRPAAGADSANQNQPKEEGKGWFPSLRDIFKGGGSKNIHLPNDSKPAIGETVDHNSTGDHRNQPWQSGY